MLLSNSRYPSFRYAIRLSHLDTEYINALPKGLFGSVVFICSAIQVPSAFNTGSDSFNRNSWRCSGVNPNSRAFRSTMYSFWISCMAYSARLRSSLRLFSTARRACAQQLTNVISFCNPNQS